MTKKSLFESNRYLRDPRKYRDALITSVSSSTAVETGESVAVIRRQITEVTGGDDSPAPSKPESSSL